MTTNKQTIAMSLKEKRLCQDLSVLVIWWTRCNTTRDYGDEVFQVYCFSQAVLVVRFLKTKPCLDCRCIRLLKDRYVHSSLIKYFIYVLNLLRFNVNKLSLEDEKDDKSQEGINKASKGGLVYGDYLQVSLKLSCLLPWSLLRHDWCFSQQSA